MSFRKSSAFILLVLIFGAWFPSAAFGQAAKTPHLDQLLVRWQEQHTQSQIPDAVYHAQVEKVLAIKSVVALYQDGLLSEDEMRHRVRQLLDGLSSKSPATKPPASKPVQQPVHRAPKPPARQVPKAADLMSGNWITRGIAVGGTHEWQVRFAGGRIEIEIIDNDFPGMYFPGPMRRAAVVRQFRQQGDRVEFQIEGSRDLEFGLDAGSNVEEAGLYRLDLSQATRGTITGELHSRDRMSGQWVAPRGVLLTRAY